MKKVVFCLSVIVLAVACTPKEDEHKEQQATDVTTISVPKQSTTVDSVSHAQQQMQQSMPATGNIEVKTYKDSLGWGYDIYVNGKKAISQPMIPAVMGNQGFASEKDAKKVGGLMKYKIEHNIMPPAVGISELDSLKIKYRK